MEGHSYLFHLDGSDLTGSSSMTKLVLGIWNFWNLIIILPICLVYPMYCNSGVLYQLLYADAFGHSVCTVLVKMYYVWINQMYVYSKHMYCTKYVRVFLEYCFQCAVCTVPCVVPGQLYMGCSKNQ